MSSKKKKDKISGIIVSSMTTDIVASQGSSTAGISLPAGMKSTSGTLAKPVKTATKLKGTSMIFGAVGKLKKKMKGGTI